MGERKVVKEETLLYFLHMFPHECHFPGHCYNLVGYELNRDTNDAFTIFICVPIGSVIVAFSGPTNIASHKAMISSLLVRVWKYLTSLSIVLVVQLSTRHISSSIWLPPVFIYIIQNLNENS